MVRFLRSTHLASVALMLALPGWTTGAGELFKAVVGLASAADTNRLAQDMASTVNNVGGVSGAVASGANIATDMINANPEIVGEIAPNAGQDVLDAAAGNYVSTGQARPYLPG